MRIGGSPRAAALAATLALTSCGGSSKSASSLTGPAPSVPATNPALPSVGDPCNAKKLGGIEIPGQKHLVCLNGKWAPEKPVRAGASCAGYNPASFANPYGTLPKNIDCNQATRRFVAEGQTCDAATYHPTIGHLYCDAASGKLSSKPKPVRPCKLGETRTVAPGIVERCVRVPQTTITTP